MARKKGKCLMMRLWGRMNYNFFFSSMLVQSSMLLVVYDSNDDDYNCI
jgi:hypothetical protein